MKSSKDRLYDLLPAIYRQRDAEQDYPLKALLQVIGEQAEIIEEDIDQLYENWFIETCQDWIVPYIGDLIGYRVVHEAGEPGDATTPLGIQRNKILIPRREVANTVRFRRRKGTLALLEQLANNVTGWPARAVEFYNLLVTSQNINHLRPTEGKTVDLHHGNIFDRLDGPFDEIAHTADMKRIDSSFSPGRYNIPNVGLFIWRLKCYSVTRSPALCIDTSRNLFTFSVLGNDTQLFTRSIKESDPSQIAGAMNVPSSISRRALDERTRDYYGIKKSLCIWKGNLKHPIPTEDIVSSDLSNWSYKPKGNKVAVDPVLGRIAFSSSYGIKDSGSSIYVMYHYSFSSDIGGGEYNRRLIRRADQSIYRVGHVPKAEFQSIGSALNQWRKDKEIDKSKRNAILEIIDSSDYVEQLTIPLEPGDHLEIRAGEGNRPIIRLLNLKTNEADYMRISRPDNEIIGEDQGEDGPELSEAVEEESNVEPNQELISLILDGLLIAGRGVQVQNVSADVVIRHCTLVPNWTLEAIQRLRNEVGYSLELINVTNPLIIDHCILGSIRIQQDEVAGDPLPIIIKDSILDATSSNSEALGAGTQECVVAHVLLSIVRSTVFGKVLVHAIELAENCIFDGLIKVARKQRGCMRFCYFTPKSRTPRRFNCQPDLAEKAIEDYLLANVSSASPSPSKEEIRYAQREERDRIKPKFTSKIYGTPGYCQLAGSCAEEISSGADDESEMGAFHDLYQPQRHANLCSRLKEYTPASTDAGIIYEN